MVKPLEFVLVLLSIGIVRSYNPATLDLTLFNSPELTCNDGSPAGYYHKSGDPDKWLVHFQGGGWCWDQSSCSQRMTDSPNLMSSKGWGNQISVGGLFDQNPVNNSYWSNATLTYIPYCTSDSFSGNRSASSGTFGWNFYGKYVTAAVISDLLPMGLATAQNVLLSGCSAGGAAVVANLDYVGSLLPPLSGRNFKGHVDAGWFLEAPYFQIPYQFTLQGMFSSGQPLWGGIPNAACMDDYPSDYWRCYLGATAVNYITTPVLFHEETEDSAQMANNGVFYPISDSAMVYLLQWRQNMTLALETSKLPVHSVFAPACFDHCITESDQFWQITIGGKLNDRDALYNFFVNNKYGLWIDDCDGFNCSEGCPAP